VRKGFGADGRLAFKAKDPLAKGTYTADLGGLTAEPGCVIKVPAKLTCVPATKSDVDPARGTAVPYALK
jgi:hypothetical protein